MPLGPSDQTILDSVERLISLRSGSYEAGVQTTVCWKAQSGWLNAITKLDFVRKSIEPPSVVCHKYRDLIISRGLFNHLEADEFLRRILVENTLPVGNDVEAVPLATPVTFSFSGKSRWPHSEWSAWPADIFRAQPGGGYQTFPPDESLVAVDAPYYPSLRQVLLDFYGISTASWMQYYQGQIAVVVPDFRARVAKLLVALTFLRADFECFALQPTDLVVKVYAEGRNGRLIQQTVRPESPFVQMDLTDRPSFVSVALLSAVSGETLDEKAFREGVFWREPNVVVEPLAPELEQLLLTGEGETIEFREKLDGTKPQRLAKTAVAFANTKGGTIVFGVDDDHRVAGCNIRGMADTVTNILRDLCDPPPAFTMRVVNHERKELLLVEVQRSITVVHTVKDLGPFIRANATNRAPTSHELGLLFQRGNSESGLPLSLGPSYFG